MNEEMKLKRGLHVLLDMITRGHSIVDIQMAASEIAVDVSWPYLEKKDKGDEEE